MRRLEEVQLNRWEQNLHHPPQAPVPRAEVSDSAELQAGGRKNGPQHLADPVPSRRACSDGVNNLSRIPHTIFSTLLSSRLISTILHFLSP